MDTKGIVCRHFLIAGRVQGVAFRASTLTQARRLQLGGWVRNLPDGRVEALACGPAESLATFEQWLSRGPIHARVDSVTASDAPVAESATFEIR